MKQGMITCPSCGHEFEMSDALTGRLRKHLEEELLGDVKKREAEIKIKSKALKAEEARIAKSRDQIDEEIEAKLKPRPLPQPTQIPRLRPQIRSSRQPPHPHRPQSVGEHSENSGCMTPFGTLPYSQNPLTLIEIY
jgi:hypothetical protein